jgi:hypothetical protein
MDIQVENVEDSTTIQSPQASARSDAVAHLALAPRFNIDSPNKEEEGKLSEIYAYAQGVSKSADIQDVLWEVMHLEGVLGAPRLGEARIDRLYRYCKLKRQEAQIQSELKNVGTSGRLYR